MRDAHRISRKIGKNPIFTFYPMKWNLANRSIGSQTNQLNKSFAGFKWLGLSKTFIDMDRMKIHKRNSIFLFSWISVIFNDFPRKCHGSGEKKRSVQWCAKFINTIENKGICELISINRYMQSAFSCIWVSSFLSPIYLSCINHLLYSIFRLWFSLSLTCYSNTQSTL